MPSFTLTPHVMNKQGNGIVVSMSQDYKMFVEQGKPNVMCLWQKGHPKLHDWYYTNGELLEERPTWIDWDPNQYQQYIEENNIDTVLSAEEGRALALEYLKRIKKQKPAATLEEALNELGPADIVRKEDTSKYASLKAKEQPEAAKGAEPIKEMKMPLFSKIMGSNRGRSKKATA